MVPEVTPLAGAPTYPDAMATDVEDLLHEAEDEIETWLCELDVTWKALLADAEERAAAMVAAATATAEELMAEAVTDAEEIESDARAVAAAARAEAASVAARARADADDIVALARLEAERIVGEANEKAGEHADVIRALTTAEREAAGEELVALRDAVSRLRTELSRLVDAAFDAFPTVEATADALDRALEEPEPEPVLVGAGAPASSYAPTPRVGLFRRLLRLRLN